MFSINLIIAIGFSFFFGVSLVFVYFIRYLLKKVSELEEDLNIRFTDVPVPECSRSKTDLSESPSEDISHRQPFDFIRRVVPLRLLNIIQQEHPQVIALVLSYLEPNKASVILENLPEEKQSDVARRIATMDRTSPEILREIERVLERKLLTLSSEDYTVAGGIEAIVEILNLVDRASEKQIIEALEDEDPELAEEIKKRMFVFEDIVMLDDRSIQKVMREVDSQELAKALKGEDKEVQNKIFKNLSERTASRLKKDMEYMGQVRLKDVEKAQQKIVSIIRHLEDIGEIVIARSDEDRMVV